MHLFLNGLAASSSSGITYLRNVIPHLSARSDIRTTLAVKPDLREELMRFPNTSFAEIALPQNAGGRFWSEQTLLPGIVRRSGAEVLVSAGNFALWNSPVPQILLSGNSLYTSQDFAKDLLTRRDYKLWLDTRVKSFFAHRSIRWADCTVAPSEAFANDLRRWTQGNIVSVHHGFDPAIFFAEQEPLPREVAEPLSSTSDSLRLLFVSHYNYFRNFETLLRALPMIREQLTGKDVKLFLTCRFRPADNPGAYRTGEAFALVQKFEIVDQVIQLGAVPYHQLHHVYKACDIYVTPAYTETFAHPVVEAMACGLPVVASNIPAHREVCDGAALFFDRFSPQELANRVVQLARSQELMSDLSQKGRARALDFSWSRHVQQIIDLAELLNAA
jgi:glycosyltransferase involved in cell wall biosynthesis